MFSSKYPDKRLNKLAANIIFLTILVYYLSFVFSIEASQSGGKNLKPNETIRSTSVRSSERRKLDINDAAATTTSSKQKQHLDSNTTTLKRQYFSASEQDKDDYRVPFWNIAHMINRIDEIEAAIRLVIRASTFLSHTINDLTTKSHFEQSWSERY